MPHQTQPAACDADASSVRCRLPRERPIARCAAGTAVIEEEEEGDEQEYTKDAARSAQTVKVSGHLRLQSHVGYNLKLVEERKKVYELIQDTPRIPELEYVPSATFTEATEEDVLCPLIDESSCILVPGAYFGDEGKGKTVDAIARHPDVLVVARVNSGENAGHTVIGENGVKYDFHLCPSGLLCPGKVNMVGPECVMDPVSFMQREVKQLIETDVEYMGRLFIGNVHLVCPHHKLLDLIGSWAAPNLSTLQGMGPVHASKAMRRGLRLDHLFNGRDGPGGSRARLERDMSTYFGALAEMGVTEQELLQKATVRPRATRVPDALTPSAHRSDPDGFRAGNCLTAAASPPPPHCRRRPTAAV